jgi:hypothetical protein
VRRVRTQAPFSYGDGQAAREASASDESRLAAFVDSSAESWYWPPLCTGRTLGLCLLSLSLSELLCLLDLRRRYTVAAMIPARSTAQPATERRVGVKTAAWLRQEQNKNAKLKGQRRKNKLGRDGTKGAL